MTPFLSLKYNQQNKQFLNFFLLYMIFSWFKGRVLYITALRSRYMYTTDKILSLSCLILVKCWHIWALHTCILSEQHNHAKKSHFSLVSNLFTVTGFVQVMEHLESREIPCYFPDLTNHGLQVGGHRKS